MWRANELWAVVLGVLVSGGIGALTLQGGGGLAAAVAREIEAREHPSLQPAALRETDDIAVTAGSDRTELLAGVHEIGAPGSPGAVAVWGDGAFAVVTGKYGSARAPVVAAARVGRGDNAGRVVIFGHTGYVEAKIVGEADTRRLLANALRWAAKRPSDDDRRAPVKAKIGVVGTDLSAIMGGEFEQVLLSRGEWQNKLDDVDVLVFEGGDPSIEQVEGLRKFLRSGKGALIAATGWGWVQVHDGRSIKCSGFNCALAPFGLGWTNEMAQTDSKERYVVKEPQSPMALLNGGAAFDALDRQDRGDHALCSADAEQAAATVALVARVLPADDTLLRPRLNERLKAQASDLVPSKEHPITTKQPLRRVLLTHQTSEMLEGAGTDKGMACAVHPAAVIFPGAVPKGAPRVDRVVEIDTKIPDWHGTGTYAAPGEAVVVQVAAAATSADLRVRIGCHTDELWGKDRWDRVPEISREFRIVGASTIISSPFGGLIYVVVPHGCQIGVTDIRLSNVVEAPQYVQGVTTIEEWRSTIRNRPAPWAEIGSGKVIITVPSAQVRMLDDPDAVTRVWDNVADAAADLAVRPRERTRPERYVADVQISAGYMHSGYPIMTHIDAADDMVSVDKIRKGTWGLFHELGHNHQNSDWTFDGTGEVTVNLFSMYIIEKVGGVPHGQTHEAFKQREKRIGEHLAAGAPYEKWKSDPFLALFMYCQLQEAFGWDAFKTVFAEYHDLSKEERPKTDEQKRDQWMVRFSRAVGKNLGPFFQAWGVPTSERARASIKDLPTWMPPEFPPN